MTYRNSQFKRGKWPRKHNHIHVTHVITIKKFYYDNVRSIEGSTDCPGGVKKGYGI